MEEKKKKRKIYLAFDMDGTIFNGSSIVVDAFSRGIMEASEVLGKKMTAPDRNAILKMVGCPAEDIYRTFFKDLKADELTAVGNICSRSFVNIINAGGGELVPGVLPAMEELCGEGCISLTASNGRKAYVEAIMSSFGLDRFFDSKENLLFCEGSIPDKTVILSIYRKRIRPDDLIIMIGDREFDRNAAHANNVPFIGCAFGHAGEDEIRGEKWIVHSFSEIPSSVKEIAGNF